MKNHLLLLLFFFHNYLFSQCPNNNTYKADLTPTGSGNTQINTCVHGGEYCTVSVTSGLSYIFSTCNNADFDTYLTLYNDVTGTYCASDDDGCGFPGGLSELVWTANFTGIVRVLVNTKNCSTHSGCAELSVTQTGCNGFSSIIYNVQSRCFNNSVTINPIGGYPQRIVSSFNVSNTGQGTLANTYPVCNRGFVTVNNLNDGDTVRIVITDKVGCTSTYSEVFKKCACQPVEFSGLPATLKCSDAPVELKAKDYNYNNYAGIIVPGFVVKMATNTATGNKVNFYQNGKPYGTFGNCSGCLPFTPNNVQYMYATYEMPSAIYEMELCEDTLATNVQNIPYEIQDIATGKIYMSGMWNVKDKKYERITIPAGTIGGIALFTGPGTNSTGDGFGTFNPAIAGPGIHKIVYSWNNEIGCSGSDTNTILVTNPYSTSITYSDNVYCQNETNPIATISGSKTGVFTESSGNVIFENIITGEINLSKSKAGGPYNIIYKVGNYNCITSDTFQLFINPIPVVNLGNDTTICNSDKLILNAYYEGATYQWHDNSTNSNYSVTNTQHYKVSVTNNCGTSSDSVFIIVTNCEITIPTIFSPNNDGINDVLVIKGIEYDEWKLQLFNRWGNEVFSTAIYKNDFTATKLVDGTYFYILSNPKNNEYFKGFIQIVR